MLEAQSRSEHRDECIGGAWTEECLIVACFAQRVAEPFQTLVETVSGGGAGRLDVLEHVRQPFRFHL